MSSFGKANFYAIVNVAGLEISDMILGKHTVLIDKANLDDSIDVWVISCDKEKFEAKNKTAITLELFGRFDEIYLKLVVSELVKEITNHPVNEANCLKVINCVHIG